MKVFKVREGWCIIHIESHGRVNTSHDLVRQMWHMNMRAVVMVWVGAGHSSGGGGHGNHGNHLRRCL